MTREPRSLLAGALVLGALLVGASFLVRQGLGEAVQADAGASLEFDRVEVVSAPLGGALDSPTGQRSVTTAPSPLSVSSEASPEGADPLTEGLSIRVLRGRSDEAIPHVAVRWVEPDLDDLQKYTNEALGSDVLDHFDVPHARDFQADESGVVRVPRPKSRAVIMAAVDGFLGWMSIHDGDEEESELRLMPEKALHVLVTTAEGLPASEAAVSLHYCIDEWSSAIQDTKTTADDGRVVFRGLRQHSDIYWAHTELFSVGLAGIYSSTPHVPSDGVRVRVEPDGPPGLVELRLPPSTSIEVRLVDGQGAPYVEPAIVRLAPPETEEDNSAATLAAVAVDGVVRFDQIGVGVDLVASVATAGRQASESAAFRSAAAAGDTVGVELAVGPRTPTFIARIVDGAGEPLCERSVALRMTDLDSGRNRYREVLSDPHGRVRFPLADGVVEADRLMLRFLSSTASDVPVGALLQHQGKLAHGDFDLGDVPLTMGSLLVAGNVQTPGGEAIPGARVRGSVEDKNAWIAAATSDEQGRFELRGEILEARLGVSGSCEGYGHASSEGVPVGSVGHTIVLSPTGRIAGSVLFASEWHCDFAEIKVSLDDEEVDWGSVRRPGEFELGGLIPGSYTIAIRMESEELSAHVVDDVLVVAGETTKDPRLQEVDLRDMRVLRFEVDGPDGRPVEGGEIYHRKAGAMSWEAWELDIENGAAYLFTRHRELDLLAVSSGTRAEFIPAVSGPRRISLRAGVPVRFEWSEEPSRDTDERQLSLWLAAHQEPKFRIRVTREQIRGGDTVLLPHAGRYAFVHGWMIRDGDRQRLERYPEVDLQIADRTATQVVTLPIAPAALPTFAEEE